MTIDVEAFFADLEKRGYSRDEITREIVRHVIASGRLDEMADAYETIGWELKIKREAFRNPVLESLLEIGGRAHREDVIALVGRKMRPRLVKHDRAYTEDNPNPRWVQHTEWTRNELRAEGLIAGVSSWGIW